jgi:hypothetical protein
MHHNFDEYSLLRQRALTRPSGTLSHPSDGRGRKY